MRSRIVVAIVFLALALILVGCGGGAEEPVQPEGTGQTEGSVAAPAAPVEAVVAVDKSPTETVVYEPFPNNPETTPQAITERLNAKQPMIVFFFDSTQKDTNDQRDVISAVLDKYRGAIDLVSFDLATFVTTQPDGSIVIDPAFASDPAAQQTASLASTLKVDYTPYIVLTDAEGYVVARYRGWVDAKDLELGVLRATS